MNGLVITYLGIMILASVFILPIIIKDAIKRKHLKNRIR